MATAKQILESIEFAAKSARKHHPTSERERVDTFVCYLSGALENKGARGSEVAKLVFELFKNDPAATDGV